MIAVAIAAAMSFSTPVASPTNVLVMTAGKYKFTDFIKVVGSAADHHAYIDRVSYSSYISVLMSL